MTDGHRTGGDGSVDVGDIVTRIPQGDKAGTEFRGGDQFGGFDGQRAEKGGIQFPDQCRHDTPHGRAGQGAPVRARTAGR
jgi:hypothetical protein